MINLDIQKGLQSLFIMARAEEGSPSPYLVFADHEYSDSETCMKSSAAQDETSGYNEDFASTSSVQRPAFEEVLQFQHQYSENYSWTKALLIDCARAIAEEDTPRIQSLLWSLNENASPYGDSDQRMASYFVQALFCRVTGTGARCLNSLGAAAEKSFCFESMRSMILEFQVTTCLNIESQLSVKHLSTKTFGFNIHR